MKRVPNRYRAFEVVLDGDTRQALTLKRAPRLLRFVRSAGGFDALDQIDDTAEPGETIIVAERVGEWPTHIKFTDRKRSGWYLWVKYKSLAVQPPDDVLRDNERWQAWALHWWQERRANGAENA